MRAFNVLHIDHIVIRVTDLPRSIAFYGDVLGCTVVKSRDDLGLTHLRAGTSMIDLISVDGPLGKRGGVAAQKEGRNIDHFCLRIEPFVEAEIVKHLAEHGVQPIGPAEENFGAEGDGLSLYFHDPDGNLVEVKGPSH